MEDYNSIKSYPNKQMEQNESTDRISSLHDELLGRILSFMPTKYAVATSILSPRWKNVYKLISTLDFDDSLITSNAPQHHDHFKRFVNGILQQCKKTYIDKFKLNCENDNYENSEIGIWVRAAVMLKVSKFEVTIQKDVHCMLPLPKWFTQHLVVLKLDCSFKVRVPKFVKFPNLKVLHLKEVTIEENGTNGLNMVLLGCTSLEELVIVDTQTQNLPIGLRYEIQFSELMCKNIIVLTLDCSYTLCIPSVVVFPKLKILFLKGITLKSMPRSLVPLVYYRKQVNDYHTLNGILSVSPLLEELVINGCNWGGGNLYLRNPMMEKLTIEDGLDGPIDQFSNCTVLLNLSKLVYFNYHVGLAKQYVIQNLNSVEQAQLEVCFNDLDYDDEQDLCDTMLELIEGIRFCRSLRLSAQCTEALTSGAFELPIFRNLIELNITLGVHVNWKDVVLDFLNCSPCLESLTLVQDGMDTELDGNFLLEAELVDCVYSKLKFINIRNFQGLEGETKMLMYFLKNATNLEEMVIHWKSANKPVVFLNIQQNVLSVPYSFCRSIRKVRT
ncbi:putative F-box/FBD/LRR-repeat protein At4g13965 [Amaranthus tricolor]|uniref:putative F-box/FBD/LRR-repeat protein At4g13965 n=1 Tax=Amaranthus tricolor TaxID=29722 RepID=UPI00258AE23F|nr:putative F-box/FBD/LRR-repeat protein At4g13965 [Amaranthus tricolor]